MSKNTSIYTQAVHAGEDMPVPDFKTTSTPVYNSSTYFYESMNDLDAVFEGSKSGYVYSRYGNPTNNALEKALAVLEKGDAALTFSSGMASIHCALLATGLQSGDTIVAAHDIYGATYTLLSGLLKKLNIDTHFVDISDISEVKNTIKTYNPKVIIFEVVSNPLLKIANIPEVIAAAHKSNAQVVVDSTFTTPYMINPLQYHADYVVHSSTKYINGHGDVLGGVAVCSEQNRESLFELTKVLGGNLGPNEAFLTLRGLKTLPVRMAKHGQNALEVAHYLEQHPQISRVYYPGLASHPQHKTASTLFNHNCFGGMVSFEIENATQKDIFRFFESLELVLPATSLGDIYSLVLYPAHSSHRGLTVEERRNIGISDGLVRFSVGIENVQDIIADIEQGLKSIL